MIIRRYDETGRSLLRELCVGRGADIGCNARKVTPECVGVDIEPSVEPDVVAPMNDLPFDDGELDFIVASHCLEHVPDVVETLAEWARVLRQGGAVGVVVPHGEYTVSATLGDASGTHRQLFTPITLKCFLEHAGFEGVEAMEYERPTAYKQAPGIFAKGTKK